MKHHTDYLTFETPNRRDYVNITDSVEEFVRIAENKVDSKVDSKVPHTHVDDEESGQQ